MISLRTGRARNNMSTQDDSESSTSSRFSPIYVIGLTQVIATAAFISFSAQRFGFTPPGSYESYGLEQLAGAIIALLATFSGTGYAALHSHHERPIARSFLAWFLYVVFTGTAALLIWLTENGWFVVLPMFGLGLLLAVVLPRGSISRTFMRITVPTLIGAFLVSLRNVADSYWSIPTPDWTLTIIASLLLAIWAISKVEASAGRSPQSVDPGPGPIRV